MKVPSIGWAFFALAALLAAWHILSHGVFIGAKVQAISRPYGEAFIHKCRYLYVNGIREVIYPEVVIETREQADQAFCPTVPNSN